MSIGDMTSDRPEKWHECLGWAEFCYNTNFYSSINMSPFQALYGRLLSLVLRYIPGATTVDALYALLVERNQLLDFLKATLKMVQYRMTHKANHKRQVVECKVGEAPNLL